MSGVCLADEAAVLQQLLLSLASTNGTTTTRPPASPASHRRSIIAVLNATVNSTANMTALAAAITTGSGNCRAGHTGPLCAVCLPGYTYQGALILVWMLCE